MEKPVCRRLERTVELAEEAGLEYVLLHQSALMGWGIDDNAFLLGPADLLVLSGHVVLPEELGGYRTEGLGAGISARLWAPRALGLGEVIETTACPRYGCRALAPELVLETLPWSPESKMLLEERALLALVINHENMTEDAVMEFAARICI